MNDGLLFFYLGQWHGYHSNIESDITITKHFNLGIVCKLLEIHSMKSIGLKHYIPQLLQKFADDI